MSIQHCQLDKLGLPFVAVQFTNLSLGAIAQSALAFCCGIAGVLNVSTRLEMFGAQQLFVDGST